MIFQVIFGALAIQYTVATVLPVPAGTTILVEEVIVNNSSSNSTSGSRNDKQLAEEDSIDVDGPYGYMPRVVHGVNKIVKGLLEGSPHKIFHGAFGIAPDDVADDLIDTYNRIMGIPDPDDLPDSVKRKTTTTQKPTSNSTAKTESPIKSKGDNLKDKKKNKDDDDDDDDDDFDDRK